MLKVKHISFDLDGTLIDSFPVMKQAWSETMFELGLAVGFDNYKKYIGLPFKDILEKLNLIRMENEIKTLYFHNTKKRLKQINLINDANKILNWCKKAKISTSIITSKPRANAEIIISNNHLNVDWVVCGDDNKKGKPFPDPGLQILENFTINADQMLYVGDMIFDLQFAQNLGAHFIHFNNQKENYLPKNLANNIYTISKLIEIKKLVTKL